MSSIVIRCENPIARRYRQGISRDARTLLKLLSLDNCELSLVLTTDSAIQELNRNFRGKDRATDVLSFPQLESNFKSVDHPAYQVIGIPSILGDVVISVDTALRQARQLGVKPDIRMRSLLIHGVLHLLGYDHERSRADARRMFARERELAAATASYQQQFRRRTSANSEAVDSA